MNIFSFVIFPLLLMSQNVLAQQSSPLLSDKDLPGWKVEAVETYTSQQLYGYINGGAELYLEYGFRMVSAQRCVQQKNEFMVDIYEMISPLAAFGMWSISHRTCASTLQGVQYSCVTNDQVLFARDKYFVNITMYDRSNETRAAARKAAEVLAKRIRGTNAELPPAFASGPLASKDSPQYFIQGPLALQSIVGNWSDHVEGIRRFDLFLTRIGKGNTATDAGLYRFRSRRDLDVFLGNVGLKNAPRKNGWLVNKAGSRAAKSIDERQLWYLEGGKQIERLMQRL